MSETGFARVCLDRESLHEAVCSGYAQAKLLLDMGKRVKVVIAAHEDDRSLQQNRFYWGACLREISDQARVAGQRYSVDAWHELFKRQFLGFEIVKVKVAGRKRTTVSRRLKSTADLTVREFTDYLDTLQAFAASELGVRFSVPDWYAHAGIDRPQTLNSRMKP